MNKYLKVFFLRGLMFGGFGPIILGVIYFVLQYSVKHFSLDGCQVFTAIISTYLLAFVQAGASVLNQIETRYPLLMTGAHLSVLYTSTLGAYLVNNWIPFRSEALVIFTAVFALGYAIIWLTVYLSVRSVSRKMNGKLKKEKPAA
ncbi:MAG: DUF3021 domain-containing protein [Clostridia bacterium]|nr:DUF3021 domain-containing protein [Clostridia bacterium]